MPDETTKLNNKELKKLANDYLIYIESKDFSHWTLKKHRRILKRFIKYVSNNRIKSENIITDQTLEKFKLTGGLTKATEVIRPFSKFLYENEIITEPLGRYLVTFAGVYGEYLEYRNYTFPKNIWTDRVVLKAFQSYLEEINRNLKDLTIHDIDSFFVKKYPHVIAKTKNRYKGHLRGFLKFIYNAGHIKKNLAPLIIGKRVFRQANPPRFLKPEEIKHLFDSIRYDTKKDLRRNAMFYIAFTLGLRAKEISLIHLDNIAFEKYEIDVKYRKNRQPTTYPLPESTLKAIIAYIIGARPDTKERRLFLQLDSPYKPITNAHIANEITDFMRKAGLSFATSYWLRHTYAQNLLENNVSIYEIKEMMGHDYIQTTKRYLSIDIKRMRGVLFNEEI